MFHFCKLFLSICQFIARLELWVSSALHSCLGSTPTQSWLTGVPVAILREDLSLAGWLSCLECHPVHQKVVGSIPWLRHIPRLQVPSWSGRVWEATNQCFSLTLVSLFPKFKFDQLKKNFAMSSFVNNFNMNIFHLFKYTLNLPLVCACKTAHPHLSYKKMCLHSYNQGLQVK